jgi:hypothetical protein
MRAKYLLGRCWYPPRDDALEGVRDSWQVMGREWRQWLTTLRYLPRRIEVLGRSVTVRLSGCVQFLTGSWRLDMPAERAATERVHDQATRR